MKTTIRSNFEMLRPYEEPHCRWVALAGVSKSTEQPRDDHSQTCHARPR